MTTTTTVRPCHRAPECFGDVLTALPAQGCLLVSEHFDRCVSAGSSRTTPASCSRYRGRDRPYFVSSEQCCHLAGFRSLPHYCPGCRSESHDIVGPLIDHSPWVAHRPGAASILRGATTSSDADDNRYQRES
jgi:hypothetical protein